MEKVLKPQRLDIDATTPDAASIYRFWKINLENLITSSFADKTEQEKHRILVQFLTHKTYPLIEDTTTYTTAIELLDKQFDKKKNECYARHLLYSRKQKPEESVDEYLTALKVLAKDCSYAAVDAKNHQDQAIRDAFINGIKSQAIRQRILEESEAPNLNQTWEKARAMETAQRNAESYSTPSFSAACMPFKEPKPSNDHSMFNQNQDNTAQKENFQSAAATAPRYQQPSNDKCWNCGRRRHTSLQLCPAKDEICYRCNRKGHYGRCCRGGAPPPKKLASMFCSPSDDDPILASTSISPNLGKSTMNIVVNGIKAKCLIDSGSTHGYISKDFQQSKRIQSFSTSSEVSMASTVHYTKISQYVIVDIELSNRLYKSVKLMVLPGCVSDIILGLDFQEQHKQVIFQHSKGHLPPLKICSSVNKFSTLNTDPPEVFANLVPGWYPVKEKSRKYSQEDKDFISKEVKRLESLGIIERSNSPWRSQVLVNRGKDKNRLCIDYSTTINRFTLLDGYPLPNMSELINQIAKYKVHSSVDMTSAYHQIPLKPADKEFTAFEANSRLYQFTRLPFGVTNGVAVFQRKMDELVEKNNLKATFPYLDNITISGHDQADHDANLEKFLAAAKKANLNFNKSKSIFSTRKLHLLGRVIEDGKIRPDPDRLKSLREIPVPTNMKALKRILGFFSYYSAWIQGFSQKIKPLVQVKTFPLCEEAVRTFQLLKQEVEDSVVNVIDENLPFVLETDASDSAIAATLNQGDKPVAFFSRTLHGSELHASAIEKEAQAIIEAVRNWRHYLTRKHFTLKTDQKSISHIFNSRYSHKIKNDKLHRWKVELSTYQFDIQHKPGRDNIPPDTLSRTCAATLSLDQLHKLHVSLGHPGITRFYHLMIISKPKTYHIQWKMLNCSSQLQCMC